ncbi:MULTISPECIES: hypothetical protein [Haloferax]|uniref:Uncharacterized protein n=2 Tax=Haloferax mediterranei (strain ATCC 33500 / DSM 1411 / JCM 8866 / NBRC 14739 / NCIMB 2177 / R-4) TaxID=523841 RepID=I3R453_HALMT|nr:hypothetical protein [Haloferax mediterranei]AFK19013.1 hypothetical protein HFX_1301 [Haloferax mediterranei ATCC 33500]MDX5989106.1 hypothetical protein [Haloferax mediterranei ATCC 33500]
MSSRNDGPPQKTMRERLIEEAQVDVHEARSKVTRVRLMYDGVPRAWRQELQEAIIAYYYALRPLRTEGLIKDWWSSVELSEEWTRTAVVDTETVLEESDDGELVEVEKPITDQIPYRGLGILEDVETATESEVVSVSDMRGEREETVSRQLVLDASILVDIAGVLDDAATKLGFAPSIELQDAAGETV